MARLGVAVALALLAETVTVGGPLAALAATPQRVGTQALHSELLAQVSVQAGRRSALVIGNGAYVDGPLANAVNDALAPLGAEVCELPMTPERILRALRKVP